MQNYREVDIKKLRRHFPSATVCNDLSDDLFIAELQYESDMDVIKYPCRFNGYIAFFCHQGRFDVNLNLRTFQVREGSLFLYTPGNIVRASAISHKDIKNVKFTLFAVSYDVLWQTDFVFFLV